MIMKKIFILSITILASISAVYAQKKDCYLSALDSINTVHNEYNTVLNPDNSKMAYTTSKTFKHGNRNEYVQVAEGEGASWYNKGTLLSLKRKISFIDVVEWPNEDTVYVYKGTAIGKILQYSYNKKKSKWQKTGKIKLCGTRVKKACFNSNRTAIYFSTKRYKGKGGQDLYVSTKEDNGKWSKPISLGDSINTKGNEIASMLIGDSILYFASDGIDGYGGYDIYYTTLQNGVWSKPVNMGLPINSDKDDAFYIKGIREREAFISSNRDGGKGGMDIYLVSYIIEKQLADGMPAYKSMIGDNLLSNINLQSETHIDSSKITLLKGFIMGDDSVYLKAKVALSDNGLRQVIATQDAEDNGAYEVILPGGANYGIAVSYPGYLFHSENFDLPEQTEYKEIIKDITLKKIAIGKNVALKNVFFETNKSDLSEESQVELGNVIRLLIENPTMCIELGGHTDNVGSKSYNKTLSEKRAKAVVDYLVDHGISPDRLSSMGYGMDKPVATNKTAEGRQENRRTELLVTKI